MNKVTVVKDLHVIEKSSVDLGEGLCSPSKW